MVNLIIDYFGIVVFWFPRASVNAIKLSQGEHAGLPLQAQDTRGFVGKPACSPWLNLMALTLARGNQKKNENSRLTSTLARRECVPTPARGNEKKKTLPTLHDYACH
jgi:hypothetical protein